MKNTIRWLLKALIAGILSLMIASAVCLVYYNPGIHITNKTGVTDYVWESNRFVSRMTEGIAWNHTDKNGFFNETNTDKNMDILVMGSSQMEGMNVFPKQKTAWLLQELTSKTTYNIGTSGHDLLVCVKNLETALSVMEPTEYVIIETGTTAYTEAAIENCLSGNMKNTPSHDSGLLFYLQKIPYLKLFYAQLQSWNGVVEGANKQQTSEESAETPDLLLTDAYEKLTKHIKEICADHNVLPIIIYHPHLTILTDGAVAASLDEASLEAFATACQANDVLFVDMTDDFVNIYYENHVLPHGFCNTFVGEGHLNRYGHKAIAERLAKIISDNSSDTQEKNQ